MTAGDALRARLRRGAGCAVRALLGQDRTQARDVLLSCLLDADDEWRTLDWNTHGHAEIAAVLQLDVGEFFARAESVVDACEEELGTRALRAIRMMDELVAWGHAPAAAWLDRYVSDGPRWLRVVENIEPGALEPSTLLRAAQRMSDAELHAVVHADPAWQRVASSDARVERAFRRASNPASVPTSSRTDVPPAAAPPSPSLEASVASQHAAATASELMDMYRSALTSPRRWPVLALMCARGLPEAARLVEDGLWDACDSCRVRCIAALPRTPPSGASACRSWR